jgi:predicted RND superfamily exporter protein
MWSSIASFILKTRFILLIITLGITGIMTWKATSIEITYDYLKVVPEDDPEMLFFKSFQKQFGEDANLFVVGMQDKSVLTPEKFNKLRALCQEIEKTEGINEVISLPTLKYLKKDTLNKKMVLTPLFTGPVSSQAELDSLLQRAKDQKFYDGILYNQYTDAMLLAISLDAKYFNSTKRQKLMKNLMGKCEDFQKDTKVTFHYAGIPFLRTFITNEVKSEFQLFMILAAVVTSVILLFFFRSFFAVIFTFVVIGITVVWSMGTIVLLGYKITLLTGILPALIIVISIPNCVYMYNKYHQEFKRHGNKTKALQRVIQKIGFLTFMTNANTAVGFMVLYFTNIIIIKEFGLVAGLMSIATFLISIVVIPTLLSFLPPPNEKQLRHLDLRFLRRVNTMLEYLVLRSRPAIYGVAAFCIVLSIYGITRIQAVSYMMDDIPHKSNVRSDLIFFEQHFKGIMPLEIVVEFDKKNAVMKPANLKKLNEFEEYLRSLNNVSPPISILNIVKGAKQAFYDGDPEYYALPNNQERSFLAPYLSAKGGDTTLIRSFVDPDGKMIRFTSKVADIGTIKMEALVQKNIKVKAEEIFKGSGATVHLTGSTLLFLKGNDYLIADLTESLFWALLLISLMMAMIFFNLKMILISLIPNILPMLMTAGIMGLFEIPLKPSTALIFGISFGISIDNTIHFLSKYKWELGQNHGNAIPAVIKTIEEVGVSMIYTSIVLFSGFVIFCFSNFGGTIALGVLTSITLFIAMFTNLILLPSLIISTSKGQKRNLYELVSPRTKHRGHHEDDDEELDLERLEIIVNEKNEV